MKQYIDKADVVAEVEKRIKINKACMLGLKNTEYFKGKVDALSDTFSFLAALEAKEVDLEKEIESQWKDCIPVDEGMGSEFANIGIEQFANIARHFFELGLRMTKKDGDMKTGAELIAEERQRQIEVEGWTKEHDAEHTNDSLALAAVCYAIPKELRNYSYCPLRKERVPDLWPWGLECWKPCPKDRIRELVKAGALIAAEIDRLQMENKD